MKQDSDLNFRVKMSKKIVLGMHVNQGIENILRSKVFQGAKGVKEQSVLRSKVFQGAKGVKKQSVLRSKVFRGVKCSLKQSVLRSKVF